MNQQEFQNPQGQRGLMPIVLSLALCAFALASTSAAQTAAASSPAPVQGAANATQTAKPSSSSSATANASNVKFKVSEPIRKKLQNLQSGKPYAFNFCNGQDLSDSLPAKFTDADGLKMDTANTQCGESNPSNTVSGGNPPYNFQLDSGSFPPLGMHLGMNGLLYGTPAPPPLGGYKPFRVCAVDLGANPDCQEMKPELPTPAKAGRAHTGLIVGTALLGGAAVAGVVAARSLSTSTTSSSSSSGSCSSITQSCNNLAAECLNDNNASACAQIPSVCTQMCQCDGFSSFNTETGSCQ